MYPTIFEFGDVVISSYSVMVLIAYFVGYKVFEHEIVRKGYDEKVADFALIAVLLGGLGGAKLLFLYQQATLSELVNDPARYLASGYSSMGGVIFSLLTLFLVSWLKKINYWTILDAAMPAFIIAYAIGRIGCLLVGDDYGIQSNLPWALSFPKGSPPTDATVHPTQVYDTIFFSLFFLFLWKIRKKNNIPGWLVSIGFIGFASQRFLIEFLRTTTPSFIEGVSQAQLFCLLLLLIFLIKFISISFKSKTMSE